MISTTCPRILFSGMSRDLRRIALATAIPAPMPNAPSTHAAPLEFPLACARPSPL